MRRLLPYLVLSLAACAPMTTQTAQSTTAAPTRVTNTITYTTGVIPVGADNPVLAAVVAIAPTAPVTGADRQPWRAEEIEKNQVVIRSNVTKRDLSTFEANMRTFPQEISFGAVASGNTTTLTATYSSAYAATADFILKQLEKRFTRVK